MIEIAEPDFIWRDDYQLSLASCRWGNMNMTATLVSCRRMQKMHGSMESRNS